MYTLASIQMLLLEREVQLNAETAAVDAGAVEICETPHIVETQAGENVVNTHAYFHIWCFGHR